MTSEPDAIARALAALTAEDNRARCEALRQLCPCRNNRMRDLVVWRAVFATALEGGKRERGQAAHAIGTLLDKARRSSEWRDLLHALQDDLDALMRDARASGPVLGTMKRHGHAHRGAARQNYRRHRSALSLATRSELAAWINQALALAEERRVAPEDPGVGRLWRWLSHRVACQPGRTTKETEMLDKARRYLPRLFDQDAPAQVVG